MSPPAPWPKAAEAAAPFNHIVLPDGPFRIVVPGMALVRETPAAGHALESPVKVARLRGKTGRVAESLLLQGRHEWTLDIVAGAALISHGLAHRVLARLEEEGWVESRDKGPGKTRMVVNPAALAEAWGQEEKEPPVALRGYLYGATPEDVAAKALKICPDGAIGGTLAANIHAPTLTRVPFPIWFWAPQGVLAGALPRRRPGGRGRRRQH